MKFIFSKDPSQGIIDMSDRLSALLNEGKNVLWLLAGGSNIPVAADVMQKVRENVNPDQIVNLTLALTDERYGPVGHADSNWHQLTLTHFDFADIQSFPILRDVSLEKTVLEYEAVITQLLKTADAIVWQYGLGADGHIAGLLPHCPAFGSTHLVHGYVAQPFTRISLTVPALKNVDVAYGFVFGSSKGKTLHKLQSETVSVEEQPAQILKSVPEVYLYQDVVS